MYTFNFTLEYDARNCILKRMYKLKTFINGPKTKKQEQAAINDPKTNELITDKEKIKEVSLAHNVEILTKKKPLPEYEHIIKEKLENHESIMKRNDDEDNWTLDRHFYSKVIQRLKDKYKNMFSLFNKAGPPWAHCARRKFLAITQPFLNGLSSNFP